MVRKGVLYVDSVRKKKDVVPALLKGRGLARRAGAGVIRVLRDKTAIWSLKKKRGRGKLSITNRGHFQGERLRLGSRKRKLQVRTLAQTDLIVKRKNTTIRPVSIVPSMQKGNSHGVQPTREPNPKEVPLDAGPSKTIFSCLKQRGIGEEPVAEPDYSNFGSKLL